MRKRFARSWVPLRNLREAPRDVTCERRIDESGCCRYCPPVQQLSTLAPSLFVCSVGSPFDSAFRLSCVRPLAPSEPPVVAWMASVGDESAVSPADAKVGELLAETEKDLVGSSVMISYSRKGEETKEAESTHATDERTGTDYLLVDLLSLRSLLRQGVCEEHLRCTCSR